MLIDGLAGSEAIDKSGEKLSIEGCDISSVKEGTAYLNYEHKSGDSGTPLDLVGKIVYAKKLFKESDCENARQRMYWNSIELPCIYIVGRLSDEAGHEGAKALAASIRDELRNDKKVMIGFSVEGSTLNRSGSILKETIIRGCAITVKACNVSSVAGVLEDPGAPEGFDKTPYKAKNKDWLEEFAESNKSEFRSSDRQILGGHLNTFTEISSDLEKTITAGSYNVAPGCLTGGAALQVEDAGLRRRYRVAMAKAAVRDWNGSGDFKTFLKARLPDADPDFLDSFAQAVNDYKVKKIKKSETPPLLLSDLLTLDDPESLEDICKADKIPGGMAEGKTPGDFDKESLAEGVSVEMEHTSDPKIAREIAMDHLTEDPQYYKKLKMIEKSTLKFEKFSVALSYTLETLLKAEKKVKANQPAPKVATAPAVHEFQGKKVIPGHIKTMEMGGWQDHAVLGHDAKHFYTVPVHPNKLKDWKPDQVERVNKAGVGQGVEVVKWPEHQDSGKVVDEKEHGDASINQTSEQKNLIHGLDMSKGEFKAKDVQFGATDSINHWRKHPKGHELYIKGEGSFSGGLVTASARNEAAYHNMARDVFDLGHYVPPVAVFNHPSTGEKLSAAQRVEGGEHYSRTNKIHHAAVQNMQDRGDLHKLGVMDFVLGSRDRHTGNYMMTPHNDAQMQLIDNSEILPESNKEDNFPTTPEYLEHHPIKLDAPVSQENKDWAMSIDPAKIRESMSQMKYSPEHIKATQDRLNFAKSMIKGSKKFSMADLFDLPYHKKVVKGEW